MKMNRKAVLTGAAAAALAAGGVGAASALSGDDEAVGGPEAEKARAAALGAVPGTVTEIGHSDRDGTGAFEVEVQRPDGSQIEVYVDADYNVVGNAPDDDAGAEDDDSGEDD